jgi:hypothetical protein
MRLIGTILARLHARPIVAFLLVYQFLFLNVILPGHTRGAVTLDGKHAAQCCCCCDHAVDGPAKSPAIPSQRDRDHCALCDFAARVTTQQVFVLRLDPIGLLARLPVPTPTVLVSADFLPTYLGTGPPTAHV